MTHPAVKRTPGTGKYILLTQAQGAHSVDMHKPWIAYSGAAAAVFRTADDVLYPALGQRKLTDLLSDGAELKRDVRVQQLGVFTTTVACYRALTDHGVLDEDHIIAVAGFSLAEISALVISRGLSLRDALQFVMARANALRDASRAFDSQFCVVSGCDECVAQRLIDAVLADGSGSGRGRGCGGEKSNEDEHEGGKDEEREEGDTNDEKEVLTIANKFSDTFFIVSGHCTAVQRLMAAVRHEADGGGRPSISGKAFELPAYHTQLFERARPALRAAIARLESIGEPRFMTLSSCTAQPFTENNMRAVLEVQLTRRLQWGNCMRQLLALRARHDATLVELAPSTMHANMGRFFSPPCDITSYDAPPPRAHRNDMEKEKEKEKEKGEGWRKEEGQGVEDKDD